MMVQMASTNTVIQTIVDEEKRGRVMSFYTMSFLGTAPFGSLLAGWLSTRVGAPHTVLLSGVLCWPRPPGSRESCPEIRVLVRPIYVRMGILPEVAQGLQSAANLMAPPEQESAVGSRQSAVGSRQSTVDSRQSTVDSRVKGQLGWHGCLAKPCAGGRQDVPDRARSLWGSSEC